MADGDECLPAVVESVAAAASGAQPAAAPAQDGLPGSAATSEPHGGFGDVATAAAHAVRVVSDAVPSEIEVSADGRWDVSPAADALRRRSAVRTLPSPFADPVSPSSASLRASQENMQLDMQLKTQRDSQPALRLELRSQLQSGAVTVPPTARLSAMVAAAIGAHDGSEKTTAGPAKRSLRRASGSTGSIPTVPSGGIPPRGPMRRTRSTAAGVATAPPPPRRSSSGSPKSGPLGPLGAPSRSSEDSGKSTPATGGSLRLSDSASSYDLDAAVSGLSTSSSNAAAPRLPSPLRRSAGHSRPPHGAISSGAAPVCGAIACSASA